ncbi:helix-turn-helix transcriptional regulator [Geodermatophilus sp. SYSU D00815]
MRADRLIAVLLLLQTRGRVTAAQVARELEVSERTARRDLEALGTAGVPVYSSPGRGGGWALVGGARTDLTGLTVDEARALFLAAGSSVATAPAVAAALRKLLGALPPPLREGARTAGSAVVVDAASWGGTAPSEPPHLPALQRAVVDGEQVVLGYTGRVKAPSTRTVSPLGLVTKAGVWYLVAGTDAGVRTFRVSRVTAVTPTGDPVQRPDGFDLRVAWERSAGEVERRRAEARVQALADPSLVPLLRRWAGPAQVTVGEPAADGRVVVELGGPSVEVLAASFAGFGRRLEITTPQARSHLLRVAEDLRRLYGEPA